jgi:hypothetical protein
VPDRLAYQDDACRHGILVKVVTSARAGGVVTVGEAGTIAVVVDTFVRAIETSDFERRLKEAKDGLSRNSDTAARRSGIGAGGALNW